MRCYGDVVEHYTISDTHEATAARFRTEDFPRGEPLWQMFGTAEEVITALLELPPPDAPGAPPANDQGVCGCQVSRSARCRAAMGQSVGPSRAHTPRARHAARLARNRVIVLPARPTPSRSSAPP